MAATAHNTVSNARTKNAVSFGITILASRGRPAQLPWPEAGQDDDGRAPDPAGGVGTDKIPIPGEMPCRRDDQIQEREGHEIFPRQPEQLIEAQAGHGGMAF